MNPRSTLDIAAIAAERARRGPAIIKTDPHGRELYEPDGAVLTRYLMSDNKVDIVQGPIGSGKTNAMFRRLGRHAITIREVDEVLNQVFPNQGQARCARILPVDQRAFFEFQILGARTIPPTNERGLLRRWHDRDNPSLGAAGSVFLDGPDPAEKF